jgi:hypothetical protein
MKTDQTLVNENKYLQAKVNSLYDSLEITRQDLDIIKKENQYLQQANLELRNLITKHSTMNKELREKLYQYHDANVLKEERNVTTADRKQSQPSGHSKRKKRQSKAPLGSKRLLERDEA